MTEEVSALDADTRERLLALLPGARAELGAHAGDSVPLRERLDALEAALRSGGDVTDELMFETARAFGARPALLSPALKGASGTDEDADEQTPLSELGNLVVEWVSEKRWPTRGRP